MGRGRSFPEAAEFVLMIVVVSTLLEIGVGNLPTGIGFWLSLKLIALTLSIAAAVFVVGILLVPYLTMLGR
jgi:hypothetical protein